MINFAPKMADNPPKIVYLRMAKPPPNITIDLKSLPIVQPTNGTLNLPPVPVPLRQVALLKNNSPKKSPSTPPQPSSTTPQPSILPATDQGMNGGPRSLILKKVVKEKKPISMLKPKLKQKSPENTEVPLLPDPPVTITQPPVPLAPPANIAPTTNRLFVVKNGEMKRVNRPIYSSSGIKRPTSTSNQSASTVRPISSNFIVNNDIPGGIMTMEQYRSRLDVHRRNLIMKRVAAAAVDPVTIYKVIRPTDINLDSAVEYAQMITKKKRGRKKGGTNKKPVVESSLLPPVPAGARTRSGRISRPPRHIQRFYTKGNNDGTARVGEEDLLFSEEDEPEPPPVMKSKAKRIFERLKCDQCGKSYVNEAKLQHHITVAHEMGGEQVDDNLRIDCFNYLLAKLKKVPTKLRGKIFLDEMGIFVTKIQRLMQKLIRSFEETCMKEGFLNYSQVHQIPKSLEGILSVPAGQYHFNTEAIDADEKTILGESSCANGDNGGAFQKVNNQLEGDRGEGDGLNASGLESDPGGTEDGGGGCAGGGGGGESTMSGFDDSSTQPLIDDAHHKDSFSDHIISLEDAIYGPAMSTSNDGVNLLSSAEEEEEEDDLTTPKKEQPSPSTRRMKKLKRVIKNLNKTNSFPEPESMIGAVGGGDGGGGIAGVHEMDLNAAGLNRPVITDLSLELFRSPNVSRQALSGGISSLPNNNHLPE